MRTSPVPLLVQQKATRLLQFSISNPIHALSSQAHQTSYDQRGTHRNLDSERGEVFVFLRGNFRCFMPEFPELTPASVYKQHDKNWNVHTTIPPRRPRRLPHHTLDGLQPEARTGPASSSAIQQWLSTTNIEHCISYLFIVLHSCLTGTNTGPC